MASVLKPRLPIKIEGKKRHLLWDFNSMAEFEELTGLNVITGAREAFSNLSATQTRALLFAQLHDDDPELTIEQAGALFHGGTDEYLSAKMLEACTFGAGKKKPDEIENNSGPVAPLPKKNPTKGR